MADNKITAISEDNDCIKFAKTAKISYRLFIFCISSTFSILYQPFKNVEQ